MKACDDLPGVCNAYPECQCGRAWRQHELVMRGGRACDDSRMRLTREAIERAVLGALRSAINDHGPITADKLTSATKRVVGNLVNAGVQVEGVEKDPSAHSENPR
jgi:hypothetical protein